MTKTALTFATLALAAVTTFAAPANALDRRVNIINETSYDMVRFYGSHVGTDSWQEDILGSDILYSGRSVRINFDDTTGYCMFDFKAVFSDGDEVVSERVNVCEVGSYRYHD